MRCRKRIICFGNPYAGNDAFGHAVYLRLKQFAGDESLEIYDGGIMGLNSLTLFESCQELVIVDLMYCSQLPTQTKEGQLLQWLYEAPYDDVELVDQMANQWNDMVHDFNLHYLLQTIPIALNMPPEKIFVVAALTASSGKLGEKLSKPLDEAVEYTSQMLWDYLIHPKMGQLCLETPR